MKKTICLFKCIMLPEESEFISSVNSLIKNFRADSMEAHCQPVYEDEDEPEHEYSFSFIRETETYSAKASVICVDSMVHFMIIVTMADEETEEPFIHEMEWDSIRKFKGGS